MAPQPDPSNRRRFPRYSFVADAEVLEGTAQMRFKARVSEIGAQGCYIDVLNPAPGNSAVRINIFKDGKAFEAEGRVAYSQNAMGMGILFTKVSPEHQAILDEWIRNASG